MHGQQSSVVVCSLFDVVENWHGSDVPRSNIYSVLPTPKKFCAHGVNNTVAISAVCCEHVIQNANVCLN